MISSKTTEKRTKAKRQRNRRPNAALIVLRGFHGAYIPAPTPETGPVFVRSHSQKPARFPAEQKERSFVETLLFPVSRGCRYNTLYFASKVVCQGDAVPIGFPATKPPVSLDSSGQEGPPPLDSPANRDASRPYWMTQRQRKGHPPLETTPKAKRNVPANYAHSILLLLKTDSESVMLPCHFSRLFGLDFPPC